ncbi:MAG TPA: hypothetical protein DEQ09_02085 [Bacteroidales bacterium]|nr:hypothetical protein [Bacteroidales bacterium]
MKRTTLICITLILAAFALNAQDQQELVSDCALSIGGRTTYLKDFVIKLPEATSKDNIPVRKENIYLMKKQSYLFTQCNAEDSQGELLIELYDANKIITSSVNKRNGKVYSSVEFSCNKTGLYTIWYTFKDGKKGTGVGIVSLLK